MKLPYSEGSVFVVPLGDGGFARGVVARSAPKGGILIGYFFGPLMESDTAIPLDDLDPTRALFRIQFGDLGLINKEWKIVGNVPDWNRSEWPIPDFVRRDPLEQRKPRLVRYSDNDPSQVEMECPIADDTALTPDRLSGYGAVEIKLTKLLRK
jgi:hypothetical protein